MTEDTLKVKLDAEWLADTVCSGFYNQSKGRLFTILESQFEGQKLAAVKKLVNDVLSGVCKNARGLIVDTLHDWEEEAEIPIESGLTPEEETEARNDYNEYAEAVR